MTKRQYQKKEKSSIEATRLDKLDRDKNVLVSPFTKIGETQLFSWVNEVLGDSLWSVLLAGLLPREKALAEFRSIISRYKDNKIMLVD